MNSPKLAEKVCAPLTVPSNPQAAPTERLEFASKFAVAHPNAWFLERCGTRKREPLHTSDGQVSASPTAVVWISGSKLVGRFLPSLQAFVFKHAPIYVGQVAITPRRLYVLGQGGQVWTAPAPHRR